MKEGKVTSLLRTILVFSLVGIGQPSSTAQEARWEELRAKVDQLYEQGKYADAVPVAQGSVRTAEVTFGPEHPSTATAQNKLGEVYLALGNYSDAEPLFHRALAIREKALGPEHPDVAKSLNNLAALYYAQRKYAEAEPLLRRSLAIREKTLGPEHLDVAVSLNNLALLYQEQGKYAEAELLYKRSLAIEEKALGPRHPDVATSLNNLAALYDVQGKYAEAEPFYKRSLAIREKALGPEHPAVAASLNNLAELYRDQGRYAEAEPLYKRSLAIEEKALGPEHPDVATSLDNLAGLYRAQGKYAQAQPLFRRSLAIRERALGPEHPDVAVSLNNLALLYKEQGKYAEAEPLYKRSLAIRERALGPEHPDVAASLNNLTALYYAQGKYAEAEPLVKRSLAIEEKALGPEHPDVAASLNNLAELYRDQGRYAEAEPLYKRSLAIWEKALGPEHPDVAKSLNNLALLYNAQGKYAEAEPLYKRSLAIEEKALGPEHPDVAKSLNNLAELYNKQGKYVEAELFFERGLQSLSSQFEYGSTYMSEKDRLAFRDTVSGLFPTYFSFCLRYRQQDPAVITKMYDVLLWEKGAIVSSAASQRARILALGDQEAQLLLERLTAKRTQLTVLLSSQPKNREEWRKTTEQLEQELNDMEKELVRRSTTFSEQERLARISWRDVQNALAQNEAAVEFVRFPFHDGQRFTDTARYVALIVTPGAPAPKLVLLGDAATLEGAPITDYLHSAGIEQTTAVATQPGFYDSFWKPLEQALAGARRIYLSPDGVFNQVSLGVVSDEQGRLLMQKYDLRIVSSTRDLLRDRRVSPAKTAVLIGNPKFALTIEEERAELQSLHLQQSPEMQVTSNLGGEPLKRGLGREENCPTRPPGGVLCPLPGTEQEVKAIQVLLESNGWQVEPPYVRAKALKEVLKSVRHPRVLHIATHGFFRPDQKIRQSDQAAAIDPMLRSGLLLAGADRLLKGETTPPDLDNGVLTAFEASSLNLQGTELVVLSACETGLGQIQNGEGVFGLRRALQEAGAEAVLMSLWSVPDRETQELMTLFYEHWLSGEDKHVALQEAQLELRKRVKERYGRDIPWYWGGFVLVGR